MASAKTILLIGSGRLAKHLQFWNSLLNSPNHLLTWDRSQDPHLLKSHLLKCSLVWLAISDTSIISFYENYLLGIDLPVVHFSGAVNDERMFCAHPLMSFPNDLLTSDVYSKIYFAVTGCKHLTDLLPNFDNKFFTLDADSKSLYHALCVIAGNFPQFLWLSTLKNFEHLSIPSEALDIYIKQISENFISLKDKALTGPFIRKDIGTIEKNLHALKSNKQLKTIYKSFLKEFYS